MAKTVRNIQASPEEVFDILADPRSYAYWVVGSKEIRTADDGWPKRGTRFDHTVGMGPLRVNDHTVVEESIPGRYLQLEARARPMGRARVKLDLDGRDGATTVTMIEEPADSKTAFVFQPVTHLLTKRRNEHSLARLGELAETRRPIPGDEPGVSPKLPVRNPEEGGSRNVAGVALAAGAVLAGAGALVWWRLSASR